MWLIQTRNSPLLNHHLSNRPLHLQKAAQLPSSCPDSALLLKGLLGSPMHAPDPTELLNSI